MKQVRGRRYLFRLLHFVASAAKTAGSRAGAGISYPQCGQRTIWHPLPTRPQLWQAAASLLESNARWHIPHVIGFAADAALSLVAVSVPEGSPIVISLSLTAELT